MMPPVHSEVLSSIVNMLLPVVHSAVTSPMLPSACRVHYLYLLLCFFYHGRCLLSGRLLRSRIGLLLVVVAGSTGLRFGSLGSIHSVLLLLLVLLYWRLTPVVRRIAGSTGLSVLL
jgi:hypothetical protein